MRNLYIFTVATLLWWVSVHLVYAFVMLEWSWFTEWGEFTRAFNLALSTVIAGNAVALKDLWSEP